MAGSMAGELTDPWGQVQTDPVAASRVVELARREADAEYLLAVLGLEGF